MTWQVQAECEELLSDHDEVFKQQLRYNRNTLTPEHVMKLLCFDLSDACRELQTHHEQAWGSGRRRQRGKGRGSRVQGTRAGWAPPE